MYNRTIEIILTLIDKNHITFYTKAIKLILVYV
jgi:hypothetical protein